MLYISFIFVPLIRIISIPEIRNDNRHLRRNMRPFPEYPVCIRLMRASTYKC